MEWTTLHMQVTTPLFNGGAEPSEADRPAVEGGLTGVRVPSLRGAMRFWFRALAGLAVGPDLRLLAAIEREVFGGTDAASPLKLRIPEQPTVSTTARPDFLQGPGDRWVGYLLGQGLATFADRRWSLNRPYLAAGQRFDLQFRMTGKPEPASLAIASLWLLCAYGGLGARTRRGFGGLRILDAVGPLPEPWDHRSIRTPGLDHYEQIIRLWPTEAIAACIGRLKRLGSSCNEVLDPRNAWAATPPTYPVLSRTHTLARTSGRKTVDTWSAVLRHTGEEFRWFRASRDYPGARYRPSIKTPEWTEVVTGSGEHFGLGALGLPVGYKGRLTVNADRGSGSAAEPLRRASPLWFRPVGDAETGWRLLSFAFLGEFLPTSAPGVPAVHVWSGRQQGKELTVTRDDVVERTAKWITTMAEGGTFVRENRSR